MLSRTREKKAKDTWGTECAALVDPQFSIDRKLRLVEALREESDDAGGAVDRFLLGEVARLREGLDTASHQQTRLREMLDSLTAAPWLPAVLVGLTTTERGPRAIVSVGGAYRVVALADNVDPASLARGDEVFLAGDSSTLTGKSPCPTTSYGETATVARALPNDRVVVRWREEEVVVNVADPLREAGLRPGDLVRWDRGCWMAFEKVEKGDGAQLFLEETPAGSFDEIGGLDPQIAALQRDLRLHLDHPAVARRYRAPRIRSVLLVGPPGTGKTMLARALANWLGELSPSGRSRFMNIKPGALHSMWFAQSEANYREAFRVAREAGAADPDVPVVMFWDEVDAIGTARRSDGQAHTDDRVLNAFMTELNGLEERGNVLVVAATNRRDVMDPALLRPGRLCDEVIDIGRPDRVAVGQIFDKYLADDIPYASSRAGSSEAASASSSAREAIIEATVSHLFAAHDDRALAHVTFRDGSRRPVRAADLLTGARIAKIAGAAARHACLREAETGDVGVRLEDLLSAADAELESAVAAVTPRNCRSHLDGLPDDLDVVRVDHRERRVSRPYRYLDLSEEVA